MTDIASVTVEDNYLHIYFEGHFEHLRRLRELSGKVLQVNRDHNCPNMLLDVRNVTELNELSTIEEHEMAQLMHEMAEHNFRVAMLFPKLSSNPGNMIGKHLENVAVNRGMMLRVFWDHSEAIEWVTGNHDREPAVLDLEPGTYYWCRCGESKTPPFCDGTHSGAELLPVAFTLEEAARVSLCGCRRTATPPFCDGTHKNPQEES